MKLKIYASPQAFREAIESRFIQISVIPAIAGGIQGIQRGLRVGGGIVEKLNG
jgi:hypothetical protein